MADLRAANKIDASKVKIENIGFPVREPMLAQGKVDAITGFWFSSFMNLKANGVPHDDIVVLLMSDYGLDLYGNAIMVNPDFAKVNPNAVRAFVRAFVKGVQDTVRDPESAVKGVMKSSPTLAEASELERLKMSHREELRHAGRAEERHRRGGPGPPRALDRADRDLVQVHRQAAGARRHLDRGVPAPEGAAAAAEVTPQAGAASPAFARMENLVTLAGVSMHYGRGLEAVQAVDRIDLTIAKGEFIAVVGPSGCGKSSLMRLISGLAPVSAGRLTVEGREVRGPLKSVGMAFQNSNLLPWRSALENVLLPLEIVEPHRGRIRAERSAYRERARRLLEKVGLGGIHRQVSVGALRRHAAAHLDLPRADPRARDPAARRAVRRARRLHPRGAVVRRCATSRPSARSR